MKSDNRLKRWRATLAWAGIHIAAIACAVLILGAVGLAIFFIAAATKGPLSGLEAVSFQLLLLSFALVGSFFFGKQSAKAAAKEIVKPHARSAFRRLVTLYEGLGRLAQTIEQGKKNAATRGETQTDADSHLNVLQAIVIEQIATANDALEDWRDVIPEAVAELERTLAERQQRQNEVHQ